MEHCRTMAMLGEGESAEVASLHHPDAMRLRLQDIGLIPGTAVRCLQKSPSGDPAAYLIRGAVIALRRQDAGRVGLL